jgi:hypothetical protein
VHLGSTCTNDITVASAHTSRPQPQQGAAKHEEEEAEESERSRWEQRRGCSREEEVDAREEAADQLQQATATGPIKAVLASPGKAAALAAGSIGAGGGRTRGTSWCVSGGPPAAVIWGAATPSAAPAELADGGCVMDGM